MLKHKEFTSALALTHFVNENKIKKEDIQQITVNIADVGPYNQWHYDLFYWV